MTILGSALGSWAGTVAETILKGKVQYLVLHVNSVCNAACRMCFTWDRMMESWNANGIPAPDLLRLARSMAPLPQLTVSGGEPLLRGDLGEILEGFYHEAGTRFFTVPTNSLRPDLVGRLIDRFLASCPEAFLNFCLPFHGDARQSDDILGAPAAYQRFLETYARIQERRRSAPNLSCLLNFVMSRYNCDDYRAIIDRARRDFPEAPLGIALTRGHTHEEGAGSFPVERYEEAHAYLAAHPRPRDGFNPYSLMFDAIGEQISRTVAAVARGDQRDLGCGAGRRLLVVYDDGTVFPCEMIDVVGLPAPSRDGERAPAAGRLGNLRDFDFDMAALLASPQAREVVGWIGCHDCACTWESAIYNRIVNSPAGLVALAGRAGKRLLAPPRPAPAEPERPDASPGSAQRTA